MARQRFQVDARRHLAHQQGFAAAGAAAHQHQRTARQRINGVDCRLAQRFVTANNQRIVHAALFQPLLDDVRAQPTPGAVEITLRMAQAGGFPGRQALLARFALHQTVAERECRLLTLLLITGADGGALFVIHQRQVKGRRQRPLGELDRRAHVDKRRCLRKQGAVVAGVGPRR